LIVNGGFNLRDEVTRLRDEIDVLRGLPVLSSEFATWLGKLAEVVAKEFGADSNELRQLRAITPELPSEFYDSVADRIEKVVPNRAVASELLTKLQSEAPAVMFQRRLHEYDDLIAAMLHGLQPKAQD
jgi:hypothetical protein